MTSTPFFEAATRSILSTPVPALPTNFKFDANSNTSAVTFVAERTIKAS